ncbi:hypothetical protein P170DRAFT_424237 [Aspergillus steynii IBT 23096]|uniref:Uncharacterized protein n=1 Tax=Aspergillus steynii IBT 23096 TaxID=1392250 RepID=A0A2I2GKW9_9EURO|nr:uncharacterized protein P170DRAFT_424237 [Aspergillus steynii IBT 23096]PLB53507.1 hypothetical protein P170DRAFT_424237 [Aspergillus steynii IBT 23096]
METPGDLEYANFKPTPTDLERRAILESHGFEFEPAQPFIASLYGYIHDAVLSAGIEETCKELSQQVFLASLSRDAMIPPPVQDTHMYHRVKVSFNIATATLGQKAQEADVRVVFTAMMWHLGTPNDLVAVRDTYEKRGKCRGQKVVVLKLKVIHDGTKARASCWVALDCGQDVDFEAAGVFDPKPDYSSDDVAGSWFAGMLWSPTAISNVLVLLILEVYVVFIR